VFYFSILPFLRDNLAVGCPRWTNNGTESVNHVLKSVTQWKLNKLPDLIEKLKALVDGQYAGADRALCGNGEFALRPEFVQHRVAVEEWRSMTPAQRNKARTQCFKLQPRQNAVTSTDGTVTVNSSQSHGRKPHQRKRSHAERTTSQKKSRTA